MATQPAPPRRPRVARPHRALDGPRRPARRDGRGAGPLLRRVRPDRSEPAHGQPRADPHRPAAAGRGARPLRPRRRRHRPDRRPAGVRGADDEPRRHRPRVGGHGSSARSSRSCRSRATTPRRWSTTTTGPRRCPRSTSCATSASTSRSTGCWPARWCGPGSRAGISYTEFSYVLLQSMDFLELFREPRRAAPVRRQRPVGQPHRRRRADPAGHRQARRTRSPRRWSPRPTARSTARREGGALWLDPAMLSPYAFYQFWLNVEDVKVGELLRIFTFLEPRGDRGARAADRGEAVPPGRTEDGSPRR